MNYPIALIFDNTEKTHIEKCLLAAQYIIKIIEDPGESGHGLVPTILSLPNMSAEQIAKLLTEVYAGLKDERHKLRLRDSVRQDINQAHRGLKKVMKAYPENWQGKAKYPWLTPSITISKVRNEERFEVRGA
jgi:hypothetical protein